MAHLAIDAVGAKHGGGAVVAQCTVQAALRHPDVTEVTLFCSSARLRRFSWPSDPRLRVVEPELPDLSLAARMAWPLLGLKRFTAGRRVDGLLCLSNAGIGPEGVPTTVMVQQPLPYSREALDCYNAATRLRIAAAQWMTRQSLRRADAVIVQTPTMRAMIEQELRLSETRIFVIPHDPGAAVAPSTEARDPSLLLYVGSNSPYKNLECLAAAVSALSEYEPNVRVACTLTADDPLLRRPRWSALGYLYPAQLQLQYQRAGVLVMPSLTETVGLPLLEAMRFGLPVVVADRPYAHDVCGDCAVFFEPTRPDSLVRALQQVWSDTAATAERVARGLNRVAAFHAKRGYEAMVSAALSAR
jgi:glycosyltransferase involved in cell wall biosynthesis